MVKYRAPFLPISDCDKCKALDQCKYVDNAQHRDFVEPDSDACEVIIILARRDEMLGRKW